MSISRIQNYIASSLKIPYFVFTGDVEYLGVKEEISSLGVKTVRISDYCNSADKLPDIDEVIDYIRTLDIDARQKKIVLIGLGEYLATIGREKAIEVLNRFKNLNIGIAKVILLLRGVESLIDMLTCDPRFDDRRYCILTDPSSNISIIKSQVMFNDKTITGYKYLLKNLEDGIVSDLIVVTDIDITNSMFNVNNLDSYYSAVKYFSNNKELTESLAEEAEWKDLLNELNKTNNLLEKVFENYGFKFNELEFYKKIRSNTFVSWLYFLYLKLNKSVLNNNPYVKFAIKNCNNKDELIAKILDSIMIINSNDPLYLDYYAERKRVIKSFSDSEIAGFISRNRKNGADSIYYLTDNTIVEKQEIIYCVATSGMSDIIKIIYPALYTYSEQYVFKCNGIADLLTTYFNEYKNQKIRNKIEPSFIEIVETQAIARKYNRLKSRNDILNSITCTDNTMLYWLDALGVEFLSYIDGLSNELGLSLRIHIAQAEIPTITSQNNGFYEEWKYPYKKSNKKLDEVKHNEKGGFDFTSEEMPIHLPKELDIIKEMMQEAASNLALRENDKYLIVSDHGASRLAVLYRKEEKYETDTKGENSGRCCKKFEPYDLPFVAEGNGYLSLSDYGRFKGGRAANVEVHGGASLEEVVIPIIELTLKNSNIIVELTNKEIVVDYSTGATIDFYLNIKVDDVKIVYKDKVYIANLHGKNIYSVDIKEINRAGKYELLVYQKDDLVGKLVIIARGKSGKTNSSFEDLF